MKRTFWRKTLLLVMVVILLPVCAAVNTYACILFYAGGDMTDDGANMFVRTEEIGADDNKVYYVSPEGKHVKGEVYQGCTDFTWIFTHDSYRYTARCDGMPGGICLSCGESHNHTPYEEAGINDHEDKPVSTDNGYQSPLATLSPELKV